MARQSIEKIGHRNGSPPVLRQRCEAFSRRKTRWRQRGCGRQTAAGTQADPNLWRDWPQEMLHSVAAVGYGNFCVTQPIPLGPSSTASAARSPAISGVSGWPFQASS